MSRVVWSSLLFFPAGLILWSLLEYVLHRHLLHRFPESFGKRHMQHHATPHVRHLAFAPLRSSVGGGIVAGIAFVFLLGWSRGLATLAGFLFGYAAYEAAHYAAHYVPSKHPWLKALRRHHMLHHHAEPEARFGVTSALWDRAFGTLPRKVGTG